MCIYILWDEWLLLTLDKNVWKVNMKSMITIWTECGYELVEHMTCDPKACLYIDWLIVICVEWKM